MQAAASTPGNIHVPILSHGTATWTLLSTLERASCTPELNLTLDESMDIDTRQSVHAAKNHMNRIEEKITAPVTKNILYEFLKLHKLAG